jgi:transcriptional regulator with XRE-family HTH domain
MIESKCIIGRIIQCLRKQKGISQKELADRMDVDRQYIWKVENGKINMSLNYLDKFIEKLESKHEDFFNETDTI